MNYNSTEIIKIYTDGSCHTQRLAGAWVAIILCNNEKIILTGSENNTTHNRMEIVAVIEAIAYANKYFNAATQINIYSDSQYVTSLPGRKQKLQSAAYCNKKGTFIQNHLLIDQFYKCFSESNITFEKITAHQKKTDVINYNIEADILARKIVREQVRLLHTSTNSQ